MPRSLGREVRVIALLVLLVLLCATGCRTAVNPATGRRDVLLMSKADEREIDAQAARQIEAEVGLVSDPRLVDYVDAVGRRVAEQSPRKDVVYSFQIAEMDEPNAFALPGGHIYVSRGLLVVANSEAELANVLGHEIAHVAARHSARQDAHVKTLGLASLVSDLMSGGAEPLPQNESISGHFAARYARNQEREADRIGQEIAVAAGIDPVGMPRFLSTLDNLTKLQTGGSQRQGYFTSHPAVPERVAEATTAAEARSWRRNGRLDRRSGGTQLESDRDAYLDRIEGMSVERPAAEGIFLDDRFLHADLGFSLRFPPGWRTINQPSRVLGLAPQRGAMVSLELQGPGDDPEEAAREYAAGDQLVLERTRALHIGGLPAFRAHALIHTPAGPISAEITWVAFDGQVYRLMAGLQAGALRRHQALFRRFAHSFRPLSDQERRMITELRLRSVRARAGETLAELGARVGNEWDLTYTAVVNGLFADQRLMPGQRIKVAIRESYRPTSAPDTDAAAEP